jgi:hypothetical protein
MRMMLGRGAANPKFERRKNPKQARRVKRGDLIIRFEIALVTG